jgi:membrane protein
MSRIPQMQAPPHHKDWNETKQALREALDEVRHAARPEPRKHFLREALSWAVALAAGGAVLARSFQTARQAASTPPEAPETLLPSDAAHRPRALAAASQTAALREALPAEPAVEAQAPGDRKASGAEAPTGAAVAEQAPISGVQGIIGLGKELYQRFTEDDGFMRAAALAFWGILSLVPLLLFALAALGFAIRDPQQAAEYVRGVILHLLPGKQAAQAANDVIAQTHIVQSAQGLIHGRWWAVLFGLLSLIWTALGLFVNATDPMNAAWDVTETRGFIKLRLVCLGVFVGALLFFLLSLLPSSGPDALRSLHIPWLGLPQTVPLWLSALFEILAVVLNMGMFTLIYRFLPNAPVSWRAAAFGGVIVAILWELFKKGFAVYLAHFGNFNKLYGTLGGIVLLITWIYYSCVVLIVGATLCKMYHERHEEGGVKRRNSAAA